MTQADTEVMLQHLPTGWSLYDGGARLATYGESLPEFTQAEADAGVLSGYWRQTRWKAGACTQYRWVAL